MIFFNHISAFTIIKFSDGVHEKGDDVDIICIFGRAKNLESVTWYRDTPSGKAEKIVTLHSTPTVEYGDKIDKGRIVIDGSQQSIRDRRFKLSKLDNNDISKYWCEIKPNIFKSNKKSQFELKGLNNFFSNDIFS